MSEGKANAQAGHAYVDALLHTLDHPHPDLSRQARAYAALRPGTKICLDAGPEHRFRILLERLVAEGIPHAVITDRDHVELPHFDGSPIVTAIGIGPLTRAQTPSFLRKLSLWTGGARARQVCGPDGGTPM